MSRKLVRTVAGKACFGLLAIAGTQSRRLDNTARVRTTGNNTFEGLPDLCLDGMKTQCFPQNYVIGAQKSGTEGLSAHPSEQIHLIPGSHHRHTSTRAGSSSLYMLLSRTFTVCGAMVCVRVCNPFLLPSFELVCCSLLSPARLDAGPKRVQCNDAQIPRLLS